MSHIEEVLRLALRSIKQLQAEVRDLTEERDQSRAHYLKLLDILWPKDRGFIPISGEFILNHAAPELRKAADTADAARKLADSCAKLFAKAEAENTELRATVERLEGLAETWIKEAGKLEPSDNGMDRAFSRALFRAGFEVQRQLAGEKG